MSEGFGQVRPPGANVPGWPLPASIVATRRAPSRRRATWSAGFARGSERRIWLIVPVVLGIVVIILPLAFDFTLPRRPRGGGTRALHGLPRGDPAAAFGLSPLMVPMLPLLGYYALSYAALGLRGRSLPGVFASPVAAHVALRVTLPYRVSRNLPIYPFSLLAPQGSRPA